MNNDNIFYLIVSIVFAVSPQLGVIGPKDQDLVISCALVKEKLFLVQGPDQHVHFFYARSRFRLPRNGRANLLT